MLKIKLFFLSLPQRIYYTATSGLEVHVLISEIPQNPQLSIISFF